MQQTPSRHWLVASALLVTAIAANEAGAWQVQIANGALPTGVTAVSGSQVMGSRYRLSDGGGWDMALWQGSNNVNNRNYGQLPGADDGVSLVSYDFTLRYEAGNGFVFQLANTTTTYSLAWGQGFDTAPPANSATTPTQSVTTLGGVTLGGGNTTPAFNGISLWARAQDTPTSYITFSNLQFAASPSPTVSGSLVNGTVSTPAGTLGSSYNQYLFSSINLADIDWVLSGTLTGYRADSASAESVSITFSALSYQGVQFVPEPASLAIVGLGGLGFFGYALRRRRQA